MKTKTLRKLVSLAVVAAIIAASVFAVSAKTVTSTATDPVAGTIHARSEVNRGSTHASLWIDDVSTTYVGTGNARIYTHFSAANYITGANIFKDVGRNRLANDLRAWGQPTNLKIVGFNSFAPRIKPEHVNHTGMYQGTTLEVNVANIRVTVFSYHAALFNGEYATRHLTNADV